MGNATRGFDSLAHWLRDRRLIPAWLLRWVCDRHEARLLRSGFSEPDEPVADVVAAFERGHAGLTGTNYQPATVWACEHMTVTGQIDRATCWQHGCVMQPVT